MESGNNTYLQSLPKKRMGSGAIIRNENDDILLLNLTYKDTMEIPGGAVEKDESPLEACHRELKEELGIDIVVKKMICVDYNSSTDSYPESLMFIFDGGIMDSKTIKKIEIEKCEISSIEFLPLIKIKSRTSNRLYKRIEKAFFTLKSDATLYLENQELI